MTDVVLVDYGSGNLRSLRAAIERTGARAVVTSDPAVVAAATRLMVPGQGAAGPTMATLRATGLEEAIRSAVDGGAHLLGVCVGLQLLFGRQRFAFGEVAAHYLTAKTFDDDLGHLRHVKTLIGYIFGRFRGHAILPIK